MTINKLQDLLTIFCMAFTLSTTVQGSDVVIEKDIVYGIAKHHSLHTGQTTCVELKLDLARPATDDGPFPAIVFIHGGGWRLGSRQDYGEEIRKAAERGYVAVTVTYRLVQHHETWGEKSTNIFPAQIHDVKAAIRWVRANAEKYRIDKNRIGAHGLSAGGHLSLMLGLTDSESGLEGEGGNANESSRVQAVVNSSGPTDMQTAYERTNPWGKELFQTFLGGTPEESPAAYQTASPTTYVTKDAPPVLTIQGGKDDLVPVQQGELLDKKMKAAGADHTLLIFEEEEHPLGGPDREKVEAAMWDFFEKHLKR